MSLLFVREPHIIDVRSNEEGVMRIDDVRAQWRNFRMLGSLVFLTQILYTTLAVQITALNQKQLTLERYSPYHSTSSTYSAVATPHAFKIIFYWLR